MDAEEQDICDYLKTWGDQYVSLKEICRRAGGKWRHREDEHWAKPIVVRMVEQGLVEEDNTGRYRLAMERDEKKKDRKQRWLSPQMQKILANKGGGGARVPTGSQVFDLGNPDTSILDPKPDAVRPYP